MKVLSEDSERTFVEDKEETTMTKSLELREAVDLLKAWAEEWDISDDPYVDGLIKDLPDQKDLTAWSSLNPLDNLPFPAPKRNFWGKYRWTLIIRNAFVFLPVSITWLSLSQAISKYKDAPAETDFLKFWESGDLNGEGVLSAFFQLNTVAWAAFILISLIVLLTIYLGYARGNAEAAEEDEHKKIEQDRQKIGISISKALDKNSWARPETIEEAFGSALQKLADAITSVSQASEKLGLTASRVELATTGVTSLSSNLDSLAKTVSSTEESFKDTASTLSKNFQSSANKISESVSLGLNSFTNNLENVDDSFNNAANHMSESFQSATNAIRSNVNQTLNTFQESVQQLTNSTVPGLGTSIEKIVSSNSQLGSELTELTAGFTSLYDTLGQLERHLHTQITELERVATQKVSDFQDELRQKNSISIQEAEKLNEMFNESFQSLANKIDENIQRVINEFGGIHSQFERSSRSIAASVSEFQEGLQAIANPDQGEGNDSR